MSIEINNKTGDVQATSFNGTTPGVTGLALLDDATASAARDTLGATSGVFPVAAGGTGAATASANTVFAGPTSGSAAAPSFRAPVLADLPNLRPHPEGIFATQVPSAVGVAITADRIVWQPVYATKAGTSMDVAFNLYAYAASGKKLKAFLYTVNADGTIGTHVATSTERVVDSTLGSGGYKTVTITTTIERGWYWVGLVSDGAPGLQCVPGYAVWGYSATALLGSYYTSHTYANSAPSGPSVTTQSSHETAALRVTVS